MERLGAEAFAGNRLDRPGRWAVAFVADWCPFCHEFLPRFARVLLSGGVRLAIADVTDEGSPLWDRFHVDVIPTLVLFEDGREVGRKDGVLGSGLTDADVTTLLAPHPPVA